VKEHSCLKTRDDGNLAQERTTSKRLRLWDLDYPKGLVMGVGSCFTRLDTLQSRQLFSSRDPRARRNGSRFGVVLSWKGWRHWRDRYLPSLVKLPASSPDCRRIFFNLSSKDFNWNLENEFVFTDGNHPESHKVLCANLFISFYLSQRESKYHISVKKHTRTIDKIPYPLLAGFTFGTGP